MPATGAQAPQSESAEALLQQFLTGLNQINSALAAVVDAASASAQAPTIVAGLKQIVEIGEKLSQIDVSQEENQRLDKVYEPQLKAAGERLQAEVKRINGNREAAAILARQVKFENFKQGLSWRLGAARRNNRMRQARGKAASRMAALDGVPAPPAAEQMVTVVIEGVPEGTSSVISDRLRKVPGVTAMSATGLNSTSTIAIGPVSDVQTVVAAVDFGTVTNVDEARRTITVRADPAKLPKPLSKPVDDPNDPAFYRQNLDDLRQTLDKNRRRRAAERLGKAPSQQLRGEIAAALLDMTGDTDSNTRRAAVEALPGWATADAAVPRLLTLLGDKEPFFVNMVIETLGKFKDVSAVEPLMALAQRHGGDVEQALAAIGPAAEPPLLKYAQGSDQKPREVALRALGAVGTEKSLPVLSKLSKSNDFVVRIEAEQSLNKIRQRSR